MKKRELRSRIAILEARICTLESRPVPKQCEDCGCLFLPKLSGTVTFYYSSPSQHFPIQLTPPRVVNGSDGSSSSASVQYIHTPELCSRCAAEHQAKSA